MKFFRILIIVCLVAACIISSKVALNAQLSNLETKKEITIAVKDNSRPLAYLNESGELQGLEIDIAKKLAQELLPDQAAINFIPVRNQDRLDALLNQQVDLVIARLSANVPRSQLIDFSIYYYLDGTGIISKNTSIKGIQDLTNSRIAVLKGSDSIFVINSRLPQAELVEVDSYQQAYDYLESLEAIAFGADQSILTGWVQQYPEYRLVSKRLSGEPLAIGIPKGLQYASLRTKINQAIANWQASGWLRERATYWGLP
jgi:polar amino acid transport system substrate-binding protein